MKERKKKEKGDGKGAEKRRGKKMGGGSIHLRKQNLRSTCLKSPKKSQWSTFFGRCVELSDYRESPLLTQLLETVVTGEVTWNGIKVIMTSGG